jgi:hypothetical protein
MLMRPLSGTDIPDGLRAYVAGGKERGSGEAGDSAREKSNDLRATATAVGSTGCEHDQCMRHRLMP